MKIRHSLVADTMSRKEGRTEELTYCTRCSALLRRERVRINRNVVSKHYTAQKYGGILV